MYLTSAEIVPKSTFTNWKGRSGKFVRTFGINTKRNNNEWRVSWESIKRYIGTAINRPGIEYEKCQDNKCDLDHVDAESFNSLIEKQKPFERTNIIDYVLDEDTETVDFIHEVNDDEFFKKLESGKIQYVSAMIWLADGGYEVKGRGRIGLPIVDAEHWKFAHHAFLTHDPAYGADVAQVKTLCEGDDCQVQLLSSKQLTAETLSAPGEDLDPLIQLPLLYKHKNQLHFISASKQVQDIILQKKADGIEINDKILAAAYSECGESNKLNTSFKSCTCSKNTLTDTDSDHKEMQSKLKAAEEENKEMKSKLKASEDHKEEMKVKSKAKYSKLFASANEEDQKKMYASLKAATDDEDELKAMDEEHENYSKSKKSASEDPEKVAIKARLQAMELTAALPMIESLVAIRQERMPEAELAEYAKGLQAKTFAEVERDYQNEAYIINSLQSKSAPTNLPTTKFDFNGGEKITSLASKSLEEIAGTVF